MYPLLLVIASGGSFSDSHDVRSPATPVRSDLKLLVGLFGAAGVRVAQLERREEEEQHPRGREHQCQPGRGGQSARSSFHNKGLPRLVEGHVRAVQVSAVS